jgi:hypothetical protein
LQAAYAFKDRAFFFPRYRQHIAACANAYAKFLFDKLEVAIVFPKQLGEEGVVIEFEGLFVHL